MGACISSDIRKTSKPNQIQNQNQRISMDSDYSSVPDFKHSNNNFVIGEKPSKIVTRPMPLDLAAKYRLSSAKFRSFGSNEDVFFESQPWLESDGDDEFYSVNGDSKSSVTSSASNTPVHKSLSVSATPFRTSEDVSVGYKLTLSPVKKRKSLSELFKENEEEENAISNHETSSSDEDTTAEEPKSDTSSKPQFANRNMDVNVKKERSQKSTHQYCFPRIFSAHSPNMTTKNIVLAA